MTIQVGKVGMIPISAIVVGDRARQDLGDLNGLEANMRESGLIAPLAVKDNKDGSYRLLAGERRLTVLKRNNVELVPVRIYEEDLSELEIKVIEKSENFHRKDMEFWEMDRLTLEIHEMQQQIHGVKAPGPTEEGWAAKDTAALIGRDPAEVSRAIQRAKAREALPELFKDCKTASDATKVLKKIDEAMVKQILARKAEEQESSGLLHELSKRFVVKDFFEGVKEIPSEVMHLVEIDPPYAINLAHQKRSAGESRYFLEDYNEIDQNEYENFLYRTFKESYRVMTKHSWLICWFAPHPWFEKIYNLLTSVGFGTTRMVGIWVKGLAGQSMNPNIRLSNAYEMFYYAWKGEPVLNKAGRNNVFQFSPVPAQDKVHPTERPVELMKEIYETFACPGSRVLIPFLGSGNGIIAAHQLGMSAVGFELSRAYKDSFLVKVNSMK